MAINFNVKMNRLFLSSPRLLNMWSSFILHCNFILFPSFPSSLLFFFFNFIWFYNVWEMESSFPALLHLPFKESWGKLKVWEGPARPWLWVSAGMEHPPLGQEALTLPAVYEKELFLRMEPCRNIWGVKQPLDQLRWSWLELFHVEEQGWGSFGKKINVTMPPALVVRLSSLLFFRACKIQNIIALEVILFPLSIKHQYTFSYYLKTNKQLKIGVNS